MATIPQTDHLSQAIRDVIQDVRLKFSDSYPWMVENEPEFSRLVGTAAIGTAMILILSFSSVGIQDVGEQVVGNSELLKDMMKFVSSSTAMKEDLALAIGTWILGKMPVSMKYPGRAMGQLMLEELGRPCYETAVRLPAGKDLAGVFETLRAADYTDYAD